MAKFATKDINSVLIVDAKMIHRRGHFIGWHFALEDKDGKIYNIKLKDLQSDASLVKIKTALTNALKDTVKDERADFESKVEIKSSILGRTISQL